VKAREVHTIIETSCRILSERYSINPQVKMQIFAFDFRTTTWQRTSKGTATCMECQNRWVLHWTSWYSAWLHFRVRCYTHTYTHTHTHYCPQSLLRFRYLVPASNGGLSPSSGFPYCSTPQLPASHNNSRRLTRSSSLNWLTNSSLTCPAYNIDMDHIETPFLCCSSIVAMKTWLFEEPLFNNGCCTVAYFAVVP
jgi:hypothetical protein